MRRVARGTTPPPTLDQCAGPISAGPTRTGCQAGSAPPILLRSSLVTQTDRSQRIAGIGPQMHRDNGYYHDTLKKCGLAGGGVEPYRGWTRIGVNLHQTLISVPAPPVVRQPASAGSGTSPTAGCVERSGTLPLWQQGSSCCHSPGPLGPCRLPWTRPSHRPPLLPPPPGARRRVPRHPQGSSGPSICSSRGPATPRRVALTPSGRTGPTSPTSGRFSPSVGSPTPTSPAATRRRTWPDSRRRTNPAPSAAA